MRPLSPQNRAVWWSKHCLDKMFENLEAPAPPPQIGYILGRRFKTRTSIEYWKKNKKIRKNTYGWVHRIVWINQAYESATLLHSMTCQEQSGTPKQTHTSSSCWWAQTSDVCRSWSCSLGQGIPRMDQQIQILEENTRPLPGSLSKSTPLFPSSTPRQPRWSFLLEGNLLSVPLHQ